MQLLMFKMKASMTDYSRYKSDIMDVLVKLEEEEANNYTLEVHYPADQDAFLCKTELDKATFNRLKAILNAENGRLHLLCEFMDYKCRVGFKRPLETEVWEAKMDVVQFRMGVELIEYIINGITGRIMAASKNVEFENLWNKEPITDVPEDQLQFTKTTKSVFQQAKSPINPEVELTRLADSTKATHEDHPSTTGRKLSVGEEFKRKVTETVFETMPNSMNLKPHALLSDVKRYSKEVIKQLKDKTDIHPSTKQVLEEFQIDRGIPSIRAGHGSVPVNFGHDLKSDIVHLVEKESKPTDKPLLRPRGGFGLTREERMDRRLETNTCQLTENASIRKAKPEYNAESTNPKPMPTDINKDGFSGDTLNRQDEHIDKTHRETSSLANSAKADGNRLKRESETFNGYGRGYTKNNLGSTKSSHGGYEMGHLSFLRSDHGGSSASLRGKSLWQKTVIASLSTTNKQLTMKSQSGFIPSDKQTNFESREEDGFNPEGFGALRRNVYDGQW